MWAYIIIVLLALIDLALVRWCLGYRKTVMHAVETSYLVALGNALATPEQETLI